MKIRLFVNMIASIAISSFAQDNLQSQLYSLILLPISIAFIAYAMYQCKWLYQLYCSNGYVLQSFLLFLLYIHIKMLGGLRWYVSDMQDHMKVRLVPSFWVSHLCFRSLHNLLSSFSQRYDIRWVKLIVLRLDTTRSFLI